MELIIRNANLGDLNDVVSLEALCFPAAEAAKEQSLRERLSVYAKGFFVGENDDRIVGFINGGATDANVIEDAFFESMSLHQDNGKNLVIFGLDVHPDYQRRGYARALMNHFINFAKEEKKESIILTCKIHLVNYYETFGYINQGVSNSEHGGAKWYDMVLSL